VGTRRLADTRTGVGYGIVAAVNAPFRPAEPLVLSWQPEEDDYVEMVRLMRRRRVLYGMTLPFTVLGALLVGEGFALRSVASAAAGVATMVVVGWLPVLLLSVRARGMYRSSPMLREPYEVRMSGDGIECRAAGITSRIPWPGVTWVVQSPRCYVVHLRDGGRRSGVLVPKRAATGADAATLRAWLEPYFAGERPDPPATSEPAPAAPEPAADAVVLRWQPEAADAAEAIQLWMRYTRYRLKMSAVLAGFVVAGAVVLALGSVGWGIGIVAGSVLPIRYLTAVSADARRRFRHDPTAQEPVTATVSTAGIDYRRTTAAMTLPWDTVAAVRESDHLYLVLLAGVSGNRAFIALPKRAGAQAETLHALLAPHLG
jgi:hypothetical protein